MDTADSAGQIGDKAVDIDLIENMITNNCMSLDIINIKNNYDIDEPIHTDQTDVEDLLTVHRIDKNEIEEQIFNLDDFYEMFADDQNPKTETADIEVHHEEDTALIENYVFDTANNLTTYEATLDPIKQTTEKSLKEFEEILKKYGTTVKSNTRSKENIQSNDVVNRDFYEVPLVFEDVQDDFDVIKEIDTEIIQIRNDTPTSFGVALVEQNDVTFYKDNSEPMVNSITYTDSEPEGYHSSDFEFITESEAKLQGLINFRKHQKPEQKSVSSSKESPKDDTNFSEPKRIIHDTSKYWSKSYNRSLRIKQYHIDMKNNVGNHMIPDGDAYLNLFQGVLASTNMFLENKSIISSACMTAQDIGFNMNGYQEWAGEPVDIKYIKEAEENAKRILEKYPRANRKRRRRY